MLVATTVIDATSGHSSEGEDLLIAATEDRPSTLRLFAACVWVILFVAQMVAPPREASAPDMLILVSWIEIVLPVLPAYFLTRRLRGRPHRSWSTAEAFECWGWVAAFVLAGTHTETPAYLALRFEAYGAYLAMDSARRLLQFALAPLLIALVAYRSMRGAGQRAWWTHAVLASIPAVLLFWVWVSRRPSF